MFKAGCGGIDIFLGGMSFLKASYLVEKLKAMMGPMAAAFVYKIAFDALSQEGGRVLDWLEHTTDALNSLQFNACKAGQAIATYTENGDFSANKSMDLVQNISGFNGNAFMDIVSGGSNKTIKQAATSQGVSPSNLTAGCPAEMTAILFTQGSMLNNVGSFLNMTDLSVFDVVRGLIGDLDISIDTDGYPTYTPVPPCSKNQTGLLDNIVNGTFRARRSSTSSVSPSACYDYSNVTIQGTAYTNLSNWVYNVICDIGDSIVNSTNYTPPEIYFMRITPLPIDRILRNNIAASADNPTIAIQNTAATYANYVASLISYNILRDVYATISDSIRQVQLLEKANSSSQI
jgi:conjugative transfer pilus assembly protein TraH